MTWFKVDDGLHAHPKTMRAGVRAVGLWTLSGSWAADQLTDGWVSAVVVARLDPRFWRQDAKALVDAGLWHVERRNGEDGWRFHDWHKWQPTRADVEKERENARERMRRIRSNGKRSSPEVHPEVRPNDSRTSGEVRDASVRDASVRDPRPVPSRPYSSSSSSSPRTLIATELGLEDDDERITKIINLVRDEHAPTALGPYLRRLATNGDLPALLERVNEPPDDPIARRHGAHPFNPDEDDECRDCPLAKDHPTHQYLRAVGG